MKSYLLTTIVIFILSFRGYGQTNDSILDQKVYKHRIGLELGFPIYGKSSVHYSYFYKNSSKFKSGLSLGVGLWYFPDFSKDIAPEIISGSNMSLTNCFVFGQKNKKFELELGGVLINHRGKYTKSNCCGPFPDGLIRFLLFPDNFSKLNLLPTCSLGFRIEPPKNKFMFRLQFGVPETVKITLGMRM